jgi:hypothetical protein
MVLECDECGDIVIPQHQETLDEMHETSCSLCTFGKLKRRKRDVVRRSDFVDLIDRLRQHYKSQDDGHLSESDQEWLDAKLDAFDQIEELIEKKDSGSGSRE